MVVQISPGTRETLEAFASGRIDMRELAGWLAQAGYDLDLPEAERDELARVDLVVTEVLESLRPEPEAMEAVSELLALAAPDATRRSA